MVLRLKKDSLIEVRFPPSTTDNGDDRVANATDLADSIYTVNTTTIVDTNSFGFTSYIKQTGKSLKPFLKYDTLTHKLSFLNVYCKQDDDDNDCTDPFLNVKSGTYQYKDTAFVLSNDTTYYYPALRELDKTVARRNYKAGKYIIKAEAIEGYEEEYGGTVQQTLTKKYHIGTQTLTAFNNEEWDKIDLKPDYHLQKNASLILLLEDETNGYAPGACGSGSHFDSYFWLVDGKSSKQLFSFSTSTCSSDINYTFKQNEEKIAGKFYLIDPSDKEDFGFQFDGSYWKDNSTYIFVISDNEKSLSRNFYLHFNVSNKKNPIRLKAGKLYKKEI